MEDLIARAFTDAPKNKGGRPRGPMNKIKRDLRDWCRKSGKEAYDNLRKLALYDENSFVRFAATKEWLAYGYGKPPNNPDEIPTAVNNAIRVTGTGGSLQDVKVIECVPGPDGKLVDLPPILPDWKEEPADRRPPAPRSSRSSWTSPPTLGSLTDDD
jgi:hypothetical protein